MTPCEPKPIVYDPFNPKYGAQHRAGIAGLYLQIEAMKRLREEGMAEVEQAEYVIPDCELIDGGRRLKIHFTEESFFSLMRERYRGTWVRMKPGKKKKEGETRRLVSKKKLPGGKKEKIEYTYEELYPLFDYLRVFGAPEAWQQQTRQATWDCYYASPPTRGSSFKIESSGTVNANAKEVWDALCATTLEKRWAGITKNLYLNAVTQDFKEAPLRESAEDALLLHFASIAATTFKPVSLKIERDKKSSEKRLECQSVWGAPVIVVPTVSHVKRFADKFIGSFVGRKDPKDGRTHDDLLISTPSEGMLAFFIAPQFAQATVEERVRGVEGVEVFSFRLADKQNKQTIVINVLNQSLDVETRDNLDKYSEHINSIRSFPYRALRVENLLRGREWYEGFDRLAARYPIELFVMRESAGSVSPKLIKESRQMARSVRKDLQQHIEKVRKEKEREMESNASPQTGNSAKAKKYVPPDIVELIYNITRNYINNRARDKSDIPPEYQLDFYNRWKKVKEKLRGSLSLSDQEEEFRKVAADYFKRKQQVAEDSFIKFRGCRNPQKFARLFTETLCMKPYGQLMPGQQRLLFPYLHDTKLWERGKSLVLMSISSVGGSDYYASPKAEGSSVPVNDADEEINDYDEAESEE